MWNGATSAHRHTLYLDKEGILKQWNCWGVFCQTEPLLLQLRKAWLAFICGSFMEGDICVSHFIMLYIQINTRAFPYWPGYHLETPIFALDFVSGQYGCLRMITRPIWKCPCIKLIITYFRHLEKRHPYWPGPIWTWSCSNPITGYFPGVWKYGQFTSSHIGHTKMPLF